MIEPRIWSRDYRSLYAVLECSYNSILFLSKYRSIVLIRRRSRLARSSGPLRIGSVHLFFCLFVRLSVAKMRTQNAIFSKTKQFKDVVFIDKLQKVPHGLFKKSIIRFLKFKMAGDLPS